MAEAGININDMAVILVFIKQLLTEQSIVSGKQGWLETAQNRTDQMEAKSTGERFHSYHIKAGERFLSANLLC